MKLVKANALFEFGLDDEKIVCQKLERIARNCYKSEDKITEDSYKTFIPAIIKRGHDSILEHHSVTAKFICDRAISHQIVRHRLCSYAQTSTRYVNYNKKEMVFIIPLKCPNIPEGTYTECSGIQNASDNENLWMIKMFDAEKTYCELIKNGWAPEEARDILPFSLATELIMTANIRQWKYILKLRTAKDADPKIRYIMNIALNSLKMTYPILFSDLTSSCPTN